MLGTCEWQDREPVQEQCVTQRGISTLSGENHTQDRTQKKNNRKKQTTDIQLRTATAHQRYRHQTVKATCNWRHCECFNASEAFLVFLEEKTK